jgi:hypothetical protein
VKRRSSWLQTIEAIYLFIWSQSYNFSIHNYIQRQRCGRLERSLCKVDENRFAFKPHNATSGVVNFYSAGVVTHDRRIGFLEPILGTTSEFTTTTPAL